MRTTTRPPTRRRLSVNHAQGVRAKAHVPHAHSDMPGVCQTCHLPILTTRDGRYLNDRHLTLDELLAQITTSYDVMAVASGERPYG